MKKQKNNILEKEQLITREMKKKKLIQKLLEKNKRNLFKSIIKTHYQMTKKKF